jgi:hypothetical protein
MAHYTPAQPGNLRSLRGVKNPSLSARRGMGFEAIPVEEEALSAMFKQISTNNRAGGRRKLKGTR